MRQLNNNSTLAVYFSDEDKMGYPFHKKEYFASYNKLSLLLSEREIQMVIVRGSSYLGNGQFSHGWRFIDNQLVSIPSSIKSTIIWNRDDKNTIPNITDHPIINSMELDKLCVDKKKTAEFFPQFSPKTKVLSSYEELSEVLETWQLKSEDLVVLKKNFETEGNGIFIQPVSEITIDLYDDWNGIIVQKFCDSSGGIPELVTGLHDIRVTVMNSKIAESYIRTPAPGKLLANTALGGSYFYIKTEKIPAKLQRLVKKIDDQLSHFPMRLYAADFFLSNKGWRLIELNSRPGMPYVGQDLGDEYFTNYYFKQLVSFFVDVFAR